MKRIIICVFAFLLVTSCLTQEFNFYPEGSEAGTDEPSERAKDDSSSNADDKEPDYSSPEYEYTITGTWTFEDPDIKGFCFRFYEDNSLVMESPGDEFEGRYTIDYNKVPVELNMFLPETGEVRTILRFRDRDTIEMENSQVGMLRPVGFGDFEVLVRVEE